MPPRPSGDSEEQVSRVPATPVARTQKGIVMAWSYGLVGAQIGLQFVGLHPRSQTSLPTFFKDLCRHTIGSMQPQLDVALHHSIHYGSVFGPWPGDIIDAGHMMFLPRSLIIRLSKWTDYAGIGETDARKLTRALFRYRKELDAIPRRFVDQQDQPRGNVAGDFKSWADDVIRAWGGALSNDPRILNALAAL